MDSNQKSSPEFTRLEEAIRSVADRVDDMDRLVGRLLDDYEKLCRNLPSEYRALSADAACTIIDEDSYAEFSVLAEYAFPAQGLLLRKGMRIRADHYRFLKDHIRNGLLLGPVDSMDDEVEKYRALSAAKREATSAMLHEAAALAAKEATKAATKKASDAIVSPKKTSKKKTTKKKAPEDLAQD